ncbi:MAG: hypothetical protein AAFY71_27940 [Bacteroidota bacterium]
MIIVISVGMSGCQLPPLPDQNGQNNGGSGQGQVQAPTTEEVVETFQALSEEVAELAKPNKVQAWVSKLIVKAQPGKDMPQIAQMEEGEIAQYLYQRTVRKEKFNLRGQDFNEAWILIKTQNDVIGWVNEGGVRYISPEFEQLIRDLLGPPPGSNARVSRGAVEIPPASQRHIIPGKSVGAITLNTSETDLINLYGGVRVVRGTVNKAGGEKEVATVVFPNTKDEIRITWKKEDHKQIKAIYFDQPDGSWFSTTGLTNGLPLKELIKVNKGPFVFDGFGWTYGGVIEDWKNGALSRYGKYFYIMLDTAPTADQKVLKKYKGQTKFTTNGPDLDKLGVYVKRLVVYLD